MRQNSRRNGHDVIRQGGLTEAIKYCGIWFYCWLPIVPGT